MPLRKPFYALVVLVALVFGLVVGLGSTKTDAAGPTPQTLAAGNNYEVCPGGSADWSVTPATNLGAGVLDVTCPTTTTAPSSTTTVPTSTTVPPTTVPPTTVPPTTVPPATTTTVPAPPLLWKPPQLFEWQWLLTGTLNTSNATQMGTGVTAWDGTKPPATNPTVYDIDGILNPASTVKTLHNMGFRAICYIEVGTAGNYYTAAQEGIPVTYYRQFADAGVLGNKLPDYNENFLNINSPKTVSILEAMISQQCAAKGFDAVETDLDTTFDNLEGKTGFNISQANEEAFLATLADYMHSVGEVWFGKNLSSTDKAKFVTAMEPFAAGVVEEQAQQYGHIGLDKPFLTAGKPVLNVEFSLAQSRYCADDIKMGVVGTKFNVALNGPRTPCDL